MVGVLDVAEYCISESHSSTSMCLAEPELLLTASSDALSESAASCAAPPTTTAEQDTGVTCDALFKRNFQCRPTHTAYQLDVRGTRLAGFVFQRTGDGTLAGCRGSADKPTVPSMQSYSG